MPARRRAQEARRAARVVLPPLWVIEDQAGAAALADEVFRPDRTEPLLVVSVASDTMRPRVSVEDLREAVGDRVHVALVTTPGVATSLSEYLPDDFQVYGGALRAYMPGATMDGNPYDHPLFITGVEADGPRTIDRVRYHLTRRGYVEPQSVPAPTTRTLTLVEAPWASQETETQPEASRERWLEEQLATARSENTELRRTIRSLNDQVEALEREAHQTGIYADPERQLRHEITTHWLLTFPEPERDRHPLVDYTLGPGFLASLDATTGVCRDKVIACIVEIITGRAWQITGLQVHQMRETERPSAPTRTREDGAIMWRASLQVNTAQARRLMWWALPGGAVELVAVGMHDEDV